MTAEQIVNLLIALSVIGLTGSYLYWLFTEEKPRIHPVLDYIQKWQKRHGVKDLEEDYESGVRWIYLLDDLMQDFDLTKDQAKSCMFHVTEPEWFNEQPYLKEEESTYVYGKIRGR